MAVEAVVFDIGNVLVEWNPERVFDAAVGPVARDHLFHRIGLHAMNEAVDAGAPFAASIAALAAEHPGHADTILIWRDRWAEMFSPAIAHSIHLLRALRRAGVPVFALSNFGAETFALAQTLYPALTEFDRRYISADMGVTKPDPAVYAMVEADCGVAPAALLFTDDRADNIAAAAKRGWGTHHFDGPAGLARRLVAEGLLSETEVQP